MIALAAGLLQREAAYLRDGRSTSAEPAPPSRAGPSAGLRLAGEYGEDPEDPAKDDPFDSRCGGLKPRGARLAVPWGTGRPGWHAECAAISLHGSARRSTCRAAGPTCITRIMPIRRRWPRPSPAWRHLPGARLNVGMVRVAGAKMAKSTGNLVLVSELLKEHPAAVSAVADP